MTAQPLTLINFTNANLQSTIKCNCVADDDYAVTNLISQDSRKLGLGFMAYHVTKPPIEVEFGFYCAVDILAVKIWTKIGALSSTGIELVTDSGLKVGDIKIDERFSGAVFMRNDIETDDIISRGEEELQVTKFYREYGLKKSKRLTLRITDTNRCAPVLKRIEILGRPSRMCALKEIEDVKRMWAKCMPNTSYPSGRNDLKDNSESQRPEIEIPEHFLDTITCDIMTLPMVLPSGKTVDQSTIDKHSDIEGSYGRMPSDPFTGKLFTKDRKPILDLVLKCEIDQFMIKNQHKIEFQQIPRTIGKRVNDNSNSETRKRLKVESIVPTTSSVTFTNKFESIDDAVQNALKGLTRYSRPPVTSPDFSSICFNCETASNLYRITGCNHLTCHQCYTAQNTNSKKTCKCGIEITNSDLIKFHNV